MNCDNALVLAGKERLMESDVRVLLLCAGSGVRWNNYLGIPKQLIEFHGEPILKRTVRLLRLNGIDDIVCVTRDSNLHLPGTVVFEPKAYRWTAETIESTIMLWAKRTIILLGDVYFTHRAIQKILSFSGDIDVFGRAWPSAYSLCNHRELFAICFNGKGAKLVQTAINEALNSAKKGAWGNLWDIYHHITGLPLDSGRIESLVFRSIDDMTNDFDTPEEYERVAYRYHLTTSPQIIDQILIRLLLAALKPFHLIIRNGYVRSRWSHKSSKEWVCALEHQFKSFRHDEESAR